MSSNANEYQTDAYAQAYLDKADAIPHRAEGERVVLELLPDTLERVLDLGAGDGRLLALIKRHKTLNQGIAVDFSTTMLDRAREQFAGDGAVEIVAHDLNESLPDWGTFDAIVSCFAIHHVEDPRKIALDREIFDRLTPGGVFCNLEHVASPTPELEAAFYHALGLTAADADPSNRCAPFEKQLDWLRTIGFVQVDCFWKWRELALLAGKNDFGTE
jgi:SAM-dependent methyltransferase